MLHLSSKRGANLDKPSIFDGFFFFFKALMWLQLSLNLKHKTQWVKNVLNKKQDPIESVKYFYILLYEGICF